MNEPRHPFTPGDPVLALRSQAGERFWQPGIVRSVGPRGARVDLGGDGPRRVPFSRLRAGALR